MNLAEADQIVKRLCAMEAIRTLHSRYCRFMDDGDFKAVAGLFIDTGVWETPYARAAGRSEIETTLRAINPLATDRKVRKHVVADAVISIVDDRATSQASYLVIVADDGKLAPVVAGTYEDTLGKGPDGWMFHSRRLVHDLAGDDLGLRL